MTFYDAMMTLSNIAVMFLMRKELHSYFLAYYYIADCYHLQNNYYIFLVSVKKKKNNRTEKCVLSGANLSHPQKCYFLVAQVIRPRRVCSYFFHIYFLCSWYLSHGLFLKVPVFFFLKRFVDKQFVYFLKIVYRR